MKNITMFFASWEAYGERWGTPHAIRDELKRRGYVINQYNLYHNNGLYDERKKTRHYSNEGVNLFFQDIRNGYEPDIVFLLDYGPFACPYLSKNNYRKALWILEAGDEPQAHRLHLQKANNFDIILSPDYSCAEHYNRLGLKGYWWTHHADENIFKPYPDIKEEFGLITTCGPRGYGHLKGLTERLQEALGNQYKNERFFYGDDHPKFLSRGKIVLQCSQFGELTRRIFEGMACGKMVLTDKLSPDTHIEDLFEDGKDIIYYSSIDECIEKARYYIEHDDERRQIALNGYNKVMANHSIKARVDEWERIIQAYVRV